MVLMACEQKQPPAGEPTEPIDMHRNLPGDSTLYGLVCDGCTDSILILLPFSGGDPDTFDIINAFHDRKIYGRPQTGDELAVILNLISGTSTKCHSRCNAVSFHVFLIR